MLCSGDVAAGCWLLRQPLEDLLVGLDASGQSVLEVRVCPTLLQVVSNRVADELGRRNAVHAGNELHVLGLVLRLTNGRDAGLAISMLHIGPLGSIPPGFTLSTMGLEILLV